MTSGLSIYGAGIEAGRTSNAMERLARFFVGQNAGAAVIEQDHVKLLRTVAGCDAGPDGVVWVHALAGRGVRQKLEENFEVVERGDDLLDAEHRDEDVGQRDAHAAI